MAFYHDGDPKQSYAKIYLKTSTKVNQIVLDFAPLTMIAEIGGFTGLLLGVSLVEINVIVEKAFKKFVF